jgi:hypothetical protein
MIDDRFSSIEFQRLGLNTPEARERADLLADEVYTRLHRAIESQLREIVERLNAMGHNLQLKNSIIGNATYPDEVDYRDESERNEHYGCRLRLTVNTVISTGYAHLIAEDDPADPL